LAVKLPGIPHHAAFELSLHKRVVKEFKQLHLERRTSLGVTDVSASPGERVKLDLSTKINVRCQPRDDALDPGPILHPQHQIDIFGRTRNSTVAARECAGDHEGHPFLLAGGDRQCRQIFNFHQPPCFPWKNVPDHEPTEADPTCA
jgi:hypothetical protein